MRTPGAAFPAWHPASAPLRRYSPAAGPRPPVPCRYQPPPGRRRRSLLGRKVLSPPQAWLRAAQSWARDACRPCAWGQRPPQRVRLRRVGRTGRPTGRGTEHLLGWCCVVDAHTGRALPSFAGGRLFQGVSWLENCSPRCCAVCRRISDQQHPRAVVFVGHSPPHAPALHRAVDAHPTGFVETTRDRFPGSRRGRPFSLMVVSPTHHFAIAAHCAGVIGTGIKGGECATGWRHRSGVGTPALEFAVPEKSTGVPVSTADGLKFLVRWFVLLIDPSPVGDFIVGSDGTGMHVAHPKRPAGH